MVRQVDFVVIGGGLAGVTCAETLRAEGATGSILLLGEEPTLPYQRPPLSKTFITSAQEMAPRPVISEARLQELGIEVALDAHVSSVDARKRLVSLHTPLGAPPAQAPDSTTGHAAKHKASPATNQAPADTSAPATDHAPEQIRFGHLLIATGASPTRLSIPGADLAGVHYLRSIGDARALRADALAAPRAVVIGASFIGVLDARDIERGTLARAMFDHAIPLTFHGAWQAASAR